MRIGIDTRISRAWKTGVGRITIQVLEHLLRQHPEHQYIVFRNPGAPPLPLAERNNYEELVLNCPVASSQQTFTFMRLPRRLRLDLLLHTHPLTAPIWTFCPSIGVVLDVYPILFPKDYPRMVSLYYRAVVPLAERTKRRVITISECSRIDAIRHLGLRPDRVQVVPLAAAPVFCQRPDQAAVQARLAGRGLSRPFIAYTGNRRPHKNLTRLLEAYALLAAQRSSLPDLVIAGFDDSHEGDDNLSHLESLIARLQISHLVRLAGELPDEGLVDLYNGAEFVAIPSLYEGFGLPALEAMACGTPVLAGRAGALPEVVGDAGLLVNPYETQAIADGLAVLIDDSGLRRRLSLAGLKRAGQFSWQETADRIERICIEAAA